MGLLTLIFGWKWKVRRLRKRWDRLREKALKTDGNYKLYILEKLDKTENKLRTLEEQPINRIVRVRIAKEVEIELEEIKEMLKIGPKGLNEYKTYLGKSTYK